MSETGGVHASGRAGAPADTPAPTQRHRPPVPIFWWVHRRSYLLFVLRELSSVFVAWFVVFLLLLVGAVHRGPEAYQAFLGWSATPWVLALNVVALAFVLLHAVTWFNLAPKALVVRVHGAQVPPRAVAAGHFGAWLVVSAVVAVILVVAL
jgi:fumarate reductase subunit C